MALLVNDKTNTSYLFPTNRIGAVSGTRRAGAFTTVRDLLAKPLVSIVGVALSSILALFFAQHGLSVYLPLILGVVIGFALTRIWGIVAGGVYACGWLGALYFAPAFVSYEPSFVLARGWAAAFLYFGAVGVGSLLHEAHLRVSRLLDERSVLSAAIATEQVRQQSFLRDVLAAVTAHRLRLCESSAELPEPLAFAPGEESVPLASAMLSEVRSRIRKAGTFAGLSDTVVGDLVIAGSEASLNAVVHATGGIAEIRADERGCLQVWVRDTGTGIDNAFLHRAVLEAGFSSKGSLGQGFSLIVSTCHQVYLHTGSQGTTIVLETEAPSRNTG